MKLQSGFFKAALIVAAISSPLTFAQTTPSPSPSGSASPSPSASLVPGQVTTTSGSLGTYLSDSTGRSLYLFEADTNDTTNCTGGCAAAWPPFTVQNGQTATAGNGDVQSSLLSTISRPDGSTQVTYNGHPLYYFAGDIGQNATNGQGLNQFGALWYLVQPSGDALTQAAGSASPSPSASATAAPVPPSTGY